MGKRWGWAPRLVPPVLVSSLLGRPLASEEQYGIFLDDPCAAEVHPVALLARALSSLHATYLAAPAFTASISAPLTIPASLPFLSAFSPAFLLLPTRLISFAIPLAVLSHSRANVLKKGD